ncbi:hypothetical protein BT63DRAFT_411203 [Microthyrium microscopicum]|uniref:Uncharacterized protein n=1 Tax=Microthyrium microscopicum TaxID=703497 RepID=A0A6A6UI45_9PEZI|nr:hypothetical protein BT63DRAFT_411203 [Microthyrium microscopicum]
MAAQLAHDVVKEAQSMGATSPIGDIESSTSPAPAVTGLPTPPTLHPTLALDPTTSSKLNQLPDDSALTQSIDVTTPSRDHAKSPFSDKALLADASGGSDTDSSKPDTVAQKDGVAGHARSNSVKKPVSFKSVSVTKNFLAKAAVATPVARSGEKAIPSTQSSPLTSSLKPRLVAKSALGGLGSRTGLTGSKGSVSGPDASKVWNKNRPAPVAPPRQFTDEELKQQYGIHMATRLTANETDKESKWADIDDDEDDWAPETVTWLDGTKSTVAPTDLPPDHPDLGLQADEPQLSESNAEISQPSPAVVVQKPVLNPSSTKTILKPGSHTAQSKPSGGLILKGGPDKQSGSAKPPAPTPAKSPWAPLPPIDKVPPVAFVPPAQPQQQRFSRDPTGFDAFQNAPSPKEIEVDDFNRVYDQPRHRELYNSHSGRFEPASEMRKGPPRNDGHRQPAVLQRHSQGQPSPAEPSAAFQTHRSGEGQVWTRNRTGSTSSAGRRMSFSRPHDMPHERTEMGPPPTPGAGAGDQNTPHNQGQHGLPGASPSTAAQSVAGPPSSENNTGEPVSQAPSEPQEDPVAKQQRLMREKIDAAKLAKQRRMEEEEREEKARKERLRLKMEALATASPSPPVEGKEKAKSTPDMPAKSPHTYKPAQVSSPPKPPVPTAEGEVAQYGVMKVHQPHPVKKANVSEGSLMGRAPAESHVDRRQPHGPEGQHHHQRPEQSQRGPGPGPEHQHHQQPSGSDHKRIVAAQGPSAWRAGGQESYGGWASSSSSNVWGPPQSKDRALGNGIFDSSNYRGLPGGANPLNHAVTSAAFSTAGTIAPGPLAPTQSGNQVPVQPAGRTLPSGPSQPGAPSSSQGPRGELLTNVVDNGDNNLRENFRSRDQPPQKFSTHTSHSLQPSPPNSQPHHPQSHLSHHQNSQFPLNSNAHSNMAPHSTKKSTALYGPMRPVGAGAGHGPHRNLSPSKMRGRSPTGYHGRDANSPPRAGYQKPSPRTGYQKPLARPPGQDQEIDPKWAAMIANDRAVKLEAQRLNSERIQELLKVQAEEAAAAKEATRHTGVQETETDRKNLDNNAFGAQPIAIAPRTLINGSPAAAPSATTTMPPAQKSSRFFPRSDQADMAGNKSTSPPPPEISSLDVAAKTEVVVNIPKKAVVKLPPTPTIAEAKVAHAASVANVKPVGNPSDMIARIQGLFKTQSSTVVHSSTRSSAPIDNAGPQSQATVSLPVKKANPDYLPPHLRVLREHALAKELADVVSKPAAEELYPPPEFGSTPTIRLPAKDIVYTDLSEQVYRPKDITMARHFKEAEYNIATSKVAFLFKEASIVVRPLATSQPKTIHIPGSRGNHTRGGHRGGYRGARRGSDNPHGPSRASSGNFTPRPNDSPSTRGGNGSPARGGNGGGRGFRGNGFQKRASTGTTA